MAEERPRPSVQQPCHGHDLPRALGRCRTIDAQIKRGPLTRFQPSFYLFQRKPGFSRLRTGEDPALRPRKATQHDIGVLVGSAVIAMFHGHSVVPPTAGRHPSAEPVENSATVHNQCHIAWARRVGELALRRPAVVCSQFTHPLTHPPEQRPEAAPGAVFRRRVRTGSRRGRAARPATPGRHTTARCRSRSPRGRRSRHRRARCRRRSTRRAPLPTRGSGRLPR